MYAFENKYDDDFLIFYYYNTDYYQLRMDRSIYLDNKPSKACSILDNW